MFQTISKLAALVCVSIDALHDLVSAGKCHSEILLETSEADVSIKRIELKDRVSARREEIKAKAAARKLEPVKAAA